jgi:Tfp pilus assembly protein PilF
MAEQWLTAYAELLDAGIALAENNQFDAAVEKYDAAIMLAPTLSPAYINRALAFASLRRHADALVDLNRSIELQPTLAIAYNNRGTVLRALGDVNAAAQDYLKAIELAGDAAVDAHGNLATYYFDTKQYEMACALYEKAIAVQPNYARTHWNFGMCLLLLGDLARGWQEYHWRWQVPSYRAAHRSFDVPMWLGQTSLNGRTILLQAEQGFGDMIQFCRYSTLAAALGARVLLEVQAGLVELCKSLDGVSEVFAINDPLPSFDFYCPMMSLPLAFATTLETIPAPSQYLTSEPTKVQKWQAKLGDKTKPRIGIVWSTDLHHQSSQSRSVPLDVFAQMLSNEYEFVSLQRMTWPRDMPAMASSAIRRFETDLLDFSETAALCECMDVVVSVDTSVAHLAGALGKPVYILLHANNDWRWLLNRSDSVWYPSAKLYRQENMFEWDGVLASLRADIEGHFVGAS